MRKFASAGFSLLARLLRSSRKAAILLHARSDAAAARLPASRTSLCFMLDLVQSRPEQIVRPHRPVLLSLRSTTESWSAAKENPQIKLRIPASSNVHASEKLTSPLMLARFMAMDKSFEGSSNTSSSHARRGVALREHFQKSVQGRVFIVGPPTGQIVEPAWPSAIA